MNPMELVGIKGRAYLQQANYEPSIHILDCTEFDGKYLILLGLSNDVQEQLKGKFGFT